MLLITKLLGMRDGGWGGHSERVRVWETVGARHLYAHYGADQKICSQPSTVRLPRRIVCKIRKNNGFVHLEMYYVS